jgi:hypothetical protein
MIFWDHWTTKKILSRCILPGVDVVVRWISVKELPRPTSKVVSICACKNAIQLKATKLSE